MTLLNLTLHLRMTGILLLAIALLNLFLPRHFSWPAELLRLTLLTRQVFIVHCCFIVLLLTLMGTLTLAFAPLLLDHTPLATILLFGLALFWTLRLLFQLLVYSPKLWRGNRLRTAMHILFTDIWLYFAGVFSIAWFNSWR